MRIKLRHSKNQHGADSCIDWGLLTIYGTQAKKNQTSFLKQKKTSKVSLTKENYIFK